jgi:hypothetical protein
MKKLLISLVLLFSLITPSKSAHAIDPKAKAFMIMTAYGTVSGALLGFATLAFGSNSRAIAQGASLGLYAGILFGAYVVNSHNNGQQPVEEYEEPYDPYAPQNPYGPRDQYNNAPYGSPAPPSQQQRPSGGGGGGFGAPAPAEDNGGFFGGRVQQINDKHMRSFQALGTHRKPIGDIPVYVNLFNTTF